MTNKEFVCVVVRRRTDHCSCYLLLQKEEQGVNFLRWAAPYGQVKEDETHHEAAIRVLEERLGLVYDAEDVKAIPDGVASYPFWGSSRTDKKGECRRYSGFSVELDPKDELVIDLKKYSFGWFTKGRVGSNGALEPSSLFVNKLEGTAL